MSGPSKQIAGGLKQVHSGLADINEQMKTTQKATKGGDETLREFSKSLKEVGEGFVAFEMAKVAAEKLIDLTLRFVEFGIEAAIASERTEDLDGAHVWERQSRAGDVRRDGRRRKPVRHRRERRQPDGDAGERRRMGARGYGRAGDALRRRGSEDRGKRRHDYGDDEPHEHAGVRHPARDQGDRARGRRSGVPRQGAAIGRGTLRADRERLAAQKVGWDHRAPRHPLPGDDGAAVSKQRRPRNGSDAPSAHCGRLDDDAEVQDHGALRDRRQPRVGHLQGLPRQRREGGRVKRHQGRLWRDVRRHLHRRVRRFHRVQGPGEHEEAHHRGHHPGDEELGNRPGRHLVVRQLHRRRAGAAPPAACRKQGRRRRRGGRQDAQGDELQGADGVCRYSRCAPVVWRRAPQGSGQASCI